MSRLLLTKVLIVTKLNFCTDSVVLEQDSNIYPITLEFFITYTNVKNRPRDRDSCE